jgi:hypothetical protein
MESLTGDEPINGRATNIVIFSDGTGQRGGVYFDESENERLQAVPRDAS